MLPFFGIRHQIDKDYEGFKEKYKRKHQIKEELKLYFHMDIPQAHQIPGTNKLNISDSERKKWDNPNPQCLSYKDIYLTYGWSHLLRGLQNEEIGFEKLRRVLNGEIPKNELNNGKKYIKEGIIEQRRAVIDLINRVERIKIEDAALKSKIMKGLFEIKSLIDQVYNPIQRYLDNVTHVFIKPFKG